MALVKIKNVAIKGIAGCVPGRVVDNMTQTYLKSSSAEKERQAFIDTTGIREVRAADDGVCGSDLAHRAGDELLNALSVDRETVDSLIFLTQTPDYLGIPPTGCILQDRLKLGTGCAAFDMTQNCGGFNVALHTAFAHAALGMRTLLLVGETLFRTTSPYEEIGGLMFGDGGAALLIEPQDGEAAYFSLNTDGSGFDAIMLKYGGYRNPVTEESLKFQAGYDGVQRNFRHGYMDKMRVLDFTREQVVPDIRKVLEFSGCGIDEINKIFLHQANLYIIDMVLRKLKTDSAKAPLSIDRFGNTSTLSIPLGIVGSMGDGKTADRGKFLLSGFGGGLTWGSAVVDFKNCYLGQQMEY